MKVRFCHVKWFYLCMLCLVATVASGVIAVVFHVPLTRSGSNSASSYSTAKSHSNEVRAVWIATASNIDFPSKKGLPAAQQEAQLQKIVDNVANLGFNTIFFQVRPDADALYRSGYFPWSSVLSGTQGQDPGYDPLAYIVSAAHKRGLRVEAWINPYRVQSKADLSALSPQSPARKHAGWTLKGADGGLYFNPGLPQVRKLILNGVKEIVKNYDVDGIHLDDYFYPSGTFDDAAAYKTYAKAGESLADWRRSNVNSLILGLHDAIKSIKSSVRFGVSPFAVWANQSQNSLGSQTNAGCQSYSTQYADTRLWVKSNWLDYICPQVYWTMDYSLASFKSVTDWWADTVKGTHVSLYIGHAVYRVGSSRPGWDTADISEIVKQLQYASQYTEYKGSAFYGYSALVRDQYGVTDSIKKYYTDTLDSTSLGNSLTVSQPKNGLVTDESSVKITGQCDANFPLTLNGKAVAVRKGGVFTARVSLASGTNTFTLSQKKTSRTAVVTYRPNALRSVSPTKDIAASSGTQVSIKAVAHKGAAVTAAVGGQRVSLRATGSAEAQSDGVTTDFTTYTGNYTLPSVKTQKNLGKITVTARWNGISKTLRGAGITVTKATAASGSIAVVKTSPYAETFDYADNMYRPTSTSQLPGAWGHVSVTSQGSAKKYYCDNVAYYRLLCGLYIRASDVSIKNLAAPAQNQISSFAEGSYDNGRYTRFTLGFSQKVTYTCGTDVTYLGTNTSGVRSYAVSGFNATRFRITFYNTDLAYAPPSTVNSPVISSVSCSKKGSEVTYVFTLKHKGIFYGVYVFYDSSGNMVLDFKNPWDGNLSTLRIAIDAGHGGKDTGALSPGGKTPNEKDLNLTYALLTRDKLVSMGVPKSNIFMTRTTDVYVNKMKRTYEMIDFRPDFSLCIHNNACDGTNVGSRSFYFQPFSKPLAAFIQRRLVAAFRKGKTVKGGAYSYSGMGTDDGATFTTIKAYYSTRQMQMPSTLVECGYVDNASEYRFLKSASGSDLISSALAQGVMDYMNGQKKYS